MVTHGYICECTDRKCRLRVRMTEEQHRRLRAKGTILHPRCRDAIGRRVLERTIDRGPGYLVLASSTIRRVAA